MKLTYAVVFEQTPNNYGAYAPDVPGCISTADTWDEMLAMIREALTFHTEFLIEDGDPVPEPTMSIGDAIAHHSEAFSEAEEDLLAEFGEPAPRRSRPGSSWSRSRFPRCNPRPSSVPSRNSDI